jgi:hypothetical protein
VVTGIADPQGAAPEPPAGTTAPGAARRYEARPGNWIVTAVALGAVVGAAVMVRPPEVAASPEPAPSPTAPASTRPAPDAAAAAYPLDCAGVPTVVALKVSADVTGDGVPETVADVHCQAGNGTPPHGVYVLGGGAAGARPRVLATLVSPKLGVSVGSLSITGRLITARMLTYSSDAVPRCCPDGTMSRTWQWKGGRFALVRTALSANT